MVLPRLAPLLYANSFNEKKKNLKARPSVRWSQEYFYVEFPFSRLP